MRIFIVGLTYTLFIAVKAVAPLFAYIANSNDDTVSVINIANNSVIATYPGGP